MNLYLQNAGSESGCAAVVALLHKNKLYVANAGDSRAVLCWGGKAVDLSVDHKPDDPVERQRIQNAGGTVTQDGRVNGGLNLSRALGLFNVSFNFEWALAFCLTVIYGSYLLFFPKPFSLSYLIMRFIINSSIYHIIFLYVAHIELYY